MLLTTASRAGSAGFGDEAWNSHDTDLSRSRVDSRQARVSPKALTWRPCQESSDAPTNSSTKDLGKTKTIATSQGHDFHVDWNDIQYAASISGASSTPSADGASRRHRRSCMVMKEVNKFRQLWSFILAGALVYTATVLPYRLAFIDFQIHVPRPQEPLFWRAAASFVDGFFWVDLMINFLFSYRTEEGREVVDIVLIARKYLATFFVPNLVACLPEDAVTKLASLFFDTGGDGISGELHQSPRLARLQRMSRLARLMRLTKLAGFMGSLWQSTFWKRLKSNRGIRVANFFTALLWIVHFLACGWYMCAALHTNEEDTWVGRRTDSNGVVLIDKSPAEQWIHSCYFVLTVFTTVGFGDIAALTVGEIIYACVVMLVGAIIHGIIVSEVINVITSIDEDDLEIGRRKDLVEHFSNHTHLHEDVRVELNEWIERSTHKTHHARYDREALKNLITGGDSVLSKSLMEKLPGELYEGRLVKNNIVAECKNVTQFLPPRFTIILAMNVWEIFYQSGEILFSRQDHPFNIFLVTRGTFAYIAEEGMLPREASGGEKGDGGLRRNSVLDASNLKGAAAVSASLLRASRHSSSSSTKPAKGARGEQDQLPVQLFSFNSYLGDMEIFFHQPRLATARCEHDGQILVFPKQHMLQMEQEFPQPTSAWKTAAARRRWTHHFHLENFAERERLMRELKDQPPYQTLAHHIIVSFWRSRRHTRRMRGQDIPSSPAPPGGEKEKSSQNRSSKPTASASSAMPYVTTLLTEGLQSGNGHEMIELRNEMRQDMHALRDLLLKSVSALRSDLGLCGDVAHDSLSASAFVVPDESALPHAPREGSFHGIGRTSL